MTDQTQVILVDENDVPTGVMEKMEAHRQGVLHRAFSVFVVNDAGKMLLQQRAHGKYHCGGLWSNACCSHPYPGEETEKAVHRRLQEEMGFDCQLQWLYMLHYKAAVGDGLTEHEMDHVFTGSYSGAVVPNANEAAGYAWLDMDEIQQQLKDEPDTFTPWFRIAFPRICNWLQDERTL